MLFDGCFEICCPYICCVGDLQLPYLLFALHTAKLWNVRISFMQAGCTCSLKLKFVTFVTRVAGQCITS
jgi:hypothetical protein